MRRKNMKQILPEGHPKWSEVEEPSFLQSFLRCFVDYSERTTIHGFKYLAERGRPIAEKIYWLVVMGMSLFICISLILNIYAKWIYSPVVINFASDETHISEIPFPAVTICPEAKSNVYKFSYTDTYIKRRIGNLTEDENRGYNIWSLVCLIIPPGEIENTTDELTIDYMFEVGLHLEDFVSDIKWNGKSFSGKIQELFFPIITGDGLCYTFNMLDRMELFRSIVKHQKYLFSTNGKQSNWSPENGIPRDALEDQYPRRTFSAGVEGGLVISFRMAKKQCDYICGRTLQGFKVYLNQPSEVPHIEQNFYRVDLERSVVAAIKPKAMTTSVGLVNYNVADRKCYFKGERFLKFFKIYNQKNCLVECATNFTLERCHCVGFYMPREELTPICGVSRRACLHGAIKSAFTKIILPKDIRRNQMKDSVECNCLPSCHSLSFDVETSETDLNFRKKLDTVLEVGELAKSNFKLSKTKSYVESELNLFFKDTQFVSLERRELYGYTDFWAGIGGTLGLFIGFSLISIFEILYYLTLRVFCNAMIFGRRYWAGAPQVTEEHETIPTISSATTHVSNVSIITYLP